MTNKMTTYNHNEEDEKTLHTMANNFDNWYDGDSSPEQKIEFENSRLQKIKDWYMNTFHNREIEEKTRELISMDKEIVDTLNDINLFHGGQFRKVDNVPFVNHPISVAKIISRITNETHLIQAALLHDVIEDVENWRGLIQKYPKEVVDLVESVTEQDKSLSWKERKNHYLGHIKNYTYPSLALSLSDRIQNLRDMIDWLEKYGNWLWNKFNTWAEDQKWFILTYSMKVRKNIDIIQDEKNKNKLLNLYDELSFLIGYFLELIEDKNLSF